MHIKEITVDGFKSYAQRVVIPGFDPQFNAITGLNGSGKSNILDSICFVRASNLTDLVYKQGLAGVTKATVSIVFDNAAKDRSPVGYDHLDEITVTRQLVIGGRSKYLINGRVAEPSRVQNLFHSVQLNVNNPHFLIMQGRITKVLNMKPPEILGLIEEAAGTKMYEGKKQAALRTLDKKQVKLEEINRVLTEDIMPALNKLRGEKAAYMEWQHASSSLERLRHFCVAHRYVEAERWAGRPLGGGADIDALIADMKELEAKGAALQQALKDRDDDIAGLQTEKDLQSSGEKRGQADIDALIADMKELEAKGAALQQALKDRDDDIAGLQTEKDLQSSGEVRELTAALDALSKRLVTETSTWKHAKESLAQEQGELARLEAALADLGEAELAARLEAAQVDAAAADATLANPQTFFQLRSLYSEIAAAKKARVLVEEEIAELSTKMRKLLARIDADKKRMGESGDLQQRLEKEYPWIPSEREHFGRPGTDYDFAARDPEEAYAEYEAACKTLESMNKRVNKKVMAMFDKAEAEYGELKRKRDVVEGDKRKIQEVMEELDEKKRAALETTWHKVNGDFGAIFSTLLPGTSAKLEPPEGETFLQGLEVRVAFGGVWKESLSELSGGQKSLLALSLILAMLLFKPAPIYILDEVDAALDLSHTQNIGRMIKTHFPQSQFIVVSLKEGMFNNANVLFRTKFVDGVSNVSRTVNKPTEARRVEDRAASQRAPLRENMRV
ncbi:Structural maintenance of chromosomes protein 2-1 [Auxenochlorella protothecoides]|uniref:Structural maintenance of chromosomes protein 2-1 n=1 Tax=Auxenochlorella protothecoides TaxID=3075 RepID=A0A087SRM4_AUXPR|nr:Structural maintenance of chromosomes protein 2-1 [Auxenochlorella protothecoides]KFM28378.1 Structural maintenance of chromosomes protein 2-1 [Auxenochlorella protothecoides]